MHSDPGEFLIGASLSILAYLILFILMKRFTQLMTPTVVKVMKYILALFIVAIIGSGTVNYLTYWSLPQSFQQGFKLIENHQRVTSQIGKVYGYSYAETDMPEPMDNPAELILTLNGTKGDMYMEVVLVKNEDTKDWSIFEFRKDSLIQDK